MKRSTVHVVRLAVCSNDVHARIIDSRMPQIGPLPGSYIVVVAFDATTGEISAHHMADKRSDAAMRRTASTNPSNIALLSIREAEVLRHIAKGETDKEIGRNLLISIGTVRVHVKTIFRKLGIYNRTQAAIISINATEIFE